MIPKLYFLFIYFLLPLVALHSQESVLYYHELNSQKGLSQSLNEFVFQDSRGFTWISSIEGLNRYDGLNVEVYKPNKAKNSIYGNNIQSNFFEDKAGNIWFSTYEAINCYRHKTNDFIHFQHRSEGKLLESDYQVIHSDPQGAQLWVKIASALYTFNIQSHFFSDTILAPFQGRRFIVHTQARTGKVQSILGWAFQSSRMREYQLSSPSVSTVIENSAWKTQKVLAISPDVLWVLSIQGLYRVSRQANGEWQSQQLALPGLELGAVPLNMLLYKRDQLLLWMPDGSLLGYNFVLNRIQRRWYLHAFNAPVRSEWMSRNMYLDPQHNIWLSIPGLGLRYASLSRKLFEYTPLSPSPQGQEKVALSALGQLKNGQILLADKYRGLLVFTPDFKPIPIQQAASIKKQEIYSFLSTGDDKTYLFTQNDIQVYDPKAARVSKLSNNAAVIYATSKLSDQHLLGLGVRPTTQLVHWSPQVTRVIRGLEPEIPTCQGALMDQNGIVFLSYNQEYIRAGRFAGDSFITHKKLKIPGLINQMVEDPRQGLIWVASSYGLFVIDQKDLSWKPYSSKPSITQQFISSMLYDQKGNLWLSTNNGLYRFDPDTGKSHHFDVVDGLPDVEFSLVAGLMSQAGRMIFGTRNGLVHFDPQKAIPLENRPKVTLLEFSARNQNKDSLMQALQKGAITLPFKSNSIAFSFLGIEYSNPEATQLLYKLEPHEKEWTYLPNTQGKVRYTNLDPGAYTLRLKAKSAEGLASENELRYQIVVKTPFKRTIWFYLLLGLVVSLVVAGISWWFFSLRLQAEREKQKVIEAERGRIMEDLHDGIGLDLTAIKSISEKAILIGQDDALRGQFEKVFSRAQDAMRTMGEIFRATDQQYNDLLPFLQWVQEKVQAFVEDLGIDQQMNMPQEKQSQQVKISAEARQNLWLVIKETLNNMAKHAQATQVSLSVVLQENKILIEIRDNGKGFDPKALRLGKGMRNMPKRMKNIGGTFEVVPQSSGTLVKLSAPIAFNRTIRQQLLQRFRQFFHVK